MSDKYSAYKLILEELVLVLGEYNEENWFAYFSKSLELLENNKPQASISHSLRAYGGMCSFSDELYFTGAPPVEAQRGYELRELLWQQCKDSENVLKRIFEL
ncbi:hypothetical protein Misp06_04476 [Microbulbifer sp. NBRC 101763]|uniref:DUF6966 domain-containing protein n=1 Tax=unclassified Microbulbifer TaxID=2619833 RepID=UPI0030A860A1